MIILISHIRQRFSQMHLYMWVRKCMEGKIWSSVTQIHFLKEPGSTLQSPRNLSRPCRKIRSSCLRKSRAQVPVPCNISDHLSIFLFYYRAEQLEEIDQDYDEFTTCAGHLSCYHFALFFLRMSSQEALGENTRYGSLFLYW